MSFISLEDFKNITKDVNKDILIELLHTYIKRDIEDIETEEPKKDEQDKEIKKITLVFENCETCELNPDMFERLSIYGIKQDITVFNSCKLIEEEYSCVDFILEINKKGLKQNASSYGNSYQSLEDRLKISKDITSVDITYSDDTRQEIYVPWSDEDEFENEYQFIKELIGNIYVIVRKGKKDE